MRQPVEVCQTGFAPRVQIDLRCGVQSRTHLSLREDQPPPKRKPISPQENEYGPAMYMNKELAKARADMPQVSDQSCRPLHPSPLRVSALDSPKTFGHFHVFTPTLRHFQYNRGTPQNPAPFPHFTPQNLQAARRVISASPHVRCPEVKRVSLISVIAPHFTNADFHNPHRTRGLRDFVYISIAHIALKKMGGRGCSATDHQFSIFNFQSSIFSS